MKASLIFSSTSHSINVQKVCVAIVGNCSPLTMTDLQNRTVESLRSKVYDTRDRKHWRAALALPSRLVAGTGTQSQAQNGRCTNDSGGGTGWSRLLPKREHERMNLMIFAGMHHSATGAMCATYTDWAKGVLSHGKQWSVPLLMLPRRHVRFDSLYTPITSGPAQYCSVLSRHPCIAALGNPLIDVLDAAAWRGMIGRVMTR
jgi:hypothetical protein